MYSKSNDATAEVTREYLYNEEDDEPYLAGSVEAADQDAGSLPPSQRLLSVHAQHMYTDAPLPDEHVGSVRACHAGGGRTACLLAAAAWACQAR
jgi:hypothetical protein